MTDLEFVSRVRGRSLSVVFAEGHDERVLAAARRLKDEGIAEPIVLASPPDLERAARAAGVSAKGITVVTPAESDKLDLYADQYARRRGLPLNVARRVVRRPLLFAGMMVSHGDAHTMVAGAATATTLVIQAGILTIGLAEGIGTPSSCFLMVLPEFQGVKQKRFVFSDCALNIAPSAAQLADIAVAAGQAAEKLLGEEPRVAMLSFSTKGSARHALVDRVTEAVAIARRKAPHMKIDGELQADAAILPAVAARKEKSPGPVSGRANVLIFPDLNSGNIAYKLTQYLAGARAVGPLLLGFAKPLADLSRNAQVDDIIEVSAICLCQALSAPVEEPSLS